MKIKVRKDFEEEVEYEVRIFPPAFTVWLLYTFFSLFVVALINYLVTP